MRYSGLNPIMTIEDIDAHVNKGFEAIGVFNPGVTEFDGKVMLLARLAERPLSDSGKVRIPTVSGGTVSITDLDTSDKRYDFSDARTVGVKGGGKLLTSISRFITAVSHDGECFEVVGDGVSPTGDYESFGIEDARITKIGEIYYITYSAVSPRGVCTALMKTCDFKEFTRLGIILSPDNKDAAILPEKINGKYYMLHRPSFSEFTKPEIWIAESDNLLQWGNHRHVCGVREGEWDSSRIGSSSVPIKTDDGYLVLYHGADSANRYCLGALLLDLNDPCIVKARSQAPLMQPINEYEINGFFGGVVFACGCLERNGSLQIYYGAADDKICRADIGIRELINSLKVVR